MMKKKLYHGSEHIIEKPLFGYGKLYNDYDAIIGYRADDSYFSFAQDLYCDPKELLELEIEVL